MECNYSWTFQVTAITTEHGYVAHSHYISKPYLSLGECYLAYYVFDIRSLEWGSVWNEKYQIVLFGINKGKEERFTLDMDGPLIQYNHQFPASKMWIDEQVSCALAQA